MVTVTGYGILVTCTVSCRYPLDTSLITSERQSHVTSYISSMASHKKMPFVIVVTINSVARISVCTDTRATELMYIQMQNAQSNANGYNNYEHKTTMCNVHSHLSNAKLFQ